MIDYMKCDLDDIVFEHRNRAYGSYSLRKSYGKNMKRAAVGGVGERKRIGAGCAHPRG